MKNLLVLFFLLFSFCIQAQESIIPSKPELVISDSTGVVASRLNSVWTVNKAAPALERMYQALLESAEREKRVVDAYGLLEAVLSCVNVDGTIPDKGKFDAAVANLKKEK